ncbi:hypothetical protein AMTRI_Chr09g18750 [Amborella trichopoda]
MRNPPWVAKFTIHYRWRLIILSSISVALSCSFFFSSHATLFAPFSMLPFLHPFPLLLAHHAIYIFPFYFIFLGLQIVRWLRGNNGGLGASRFVKRWLLMSVFFSYFFFSFFEFLLFSLFHNTFKTMITLKIGCSEKYDILK